MIRAGLCSDEEREKCEEEFGEENLDWSCQNCPKVRPEDLHPYTLKLFRIRNMRMAGYPLKANDLTLEEWEDLGKIEQWLLTPQKSK